MVNDRRSSEYWDLRGRVAWEVNPRNWLEGGFEWTEEDAVYRYTSEASFTDSVADLFARDTGFSRATFLTPSRERFALYAAHRWQILEALVSEIGMRAQKTITTGAPPRTGASIRASISAGSSGRQPAFALIGGASTRPTKYTS